MFNMAKKSVKSAPKSVVAKDVSGLSSGSLLIVLVFLTLVILLGLLKLQGV